MEEGQGKGEGACSLATKERQNQGTAALALPQAVKVDAAKASEILTPHNVSLQEAARYYVRHVIAYRNAPLINKIVKQMLADAEKNDRRDRTVSELKSRLNSFAEGFPNQRMSDLTVEEIKAWIDEDEDWSARTRINYLTKISQLFNYLKHNWVDTNLVERIDRVASASVCGSKISVRRVMEVFKAKRLDASEGH